MRQGLRSHLTYANVMVTILAFLVLSGGTAVALSGSNTVQSDDLGPGAQVQAADVAANAVNGQDVADNSLGGADILESSLTGNARALIYNATASTAATPPKTPITTAGPYTIKGQCLFDSNTLEVAARIYVNGPSGTENSMWDLSANNNADNGTRSGGLQIPANADLQVVEIRSGFGNFERGGGTTMLRSGSVLIQVDFHAVADARNSQQACFIYGTATRAT
jgi:hypothetical protein